MPPGGADEDRWATLPDCLRRTVRGWEEAQAEWVREGLIDEFPQIVELTNTWRRLLLVAEAALAFPELNRFSASASHNVIRLRQGGEDVLWISSPVEGSYRVEKITPRAERPLGFEVDAEQVFEGDAPDLIDFIRTWPEERHRITK
jgi:hypothetical protein